MCGQYFSLEKMYLFKHQVNHEPFQNGRTKQESVPNPASERVEN